MHVGGSNQKGSRQKRTQAITEIKHCSIFKGELKRLGLTTHRPRRRGKTAKVPTLKALSICEAIIRAEVVISTNIQACQKKDYWQKCAPAHISAQPFPPIWTACAYWKHTRSILNILLPVRTACTYSKRRPQSRSGVQGTMDSKTKETAFKPATYVCATQPQNWMSKSTF